MLLSPATIGAIQQDPIRRIFKQASLDLRFADNKSLVDATTGAQLVTFTRASSGTFVGSNGLLQSAVTNLLLRSEEFGTTWSATATTVTSNTTTSPNGTLTADTLTDTNAVGDAFLRQSIANPPNSATYTGSVYFKQGTTATTRVSLDFIGATAINRDAIITWSSNTTNFGTLTNVGNGWYRLSFSETNNTSGNTSLLFTIRASGDATGADTGTVHVWGAQLEQSTTVGEYIPTTSTINSAPRFDHNPTTGESLGLLVEEQRTNLLVRSEEFDSGSWGKTNTTITANAIVSPNGAITADAIFETAATGEHFVRQVITGLTANTNFTTSIFVKNLDGRNLQIRILDLNLVTNGYIGIFSPNTGTVISSSSVGSGVLTSASIVPYSNGWYRAILTGNAGVTCTAYIMDVYSLSGTTTVFAGDITKGLYLWGAQLE